MAKRGGNKKGNPQTSTNAVVNKQITLREANTGKLQAKGAPRNSKSFLKRDHLKSLALWATQDAPIPSLAAFYGRQLAAADEALGNPPDPSSFSCRRCETILRPGFNCTIRIEKNPSKLRRKGNKPGTVASNSMVFKCHFCSHQNHKRGTPKGYLKEICPPKSKPPTNSQLSTPIRPKSVSTENGSVSKDEPGKIEKSEAGMPALPESTSTAVSSALPAFPDSTSMADCPVTPLVRTGATLLDGRKRKRNKSGKKKPSESDGSAAAVDVEKTVATSSKKKRKTWTSLKEIVENSDQSRIYTDIKMPLFG